jgi:hypothetical protein
MEGEEFLPRAPLSVLYRKHYLHKARPARRFGWN